MKKAYWCSALLISVGLIFTAPAHAVLLGPSAYLQFSDSPFSGGAFDYFYLEDFEDHLFNVPGVTASAGGVTSVVYGPSIHDSVDADDGSIDNNSLAGDSFFSGSGSTGIRFTFDATVLGSLPTSAGLVWTDGAGNIEFEAFDELNNSLGQLVGRMRMASTMGQRLKTVFTAPPTPTGFPPCLSGICPEGLKWIISNSVLTAAAGHQTPSPNLPR